MNHKNIIRAVKGAFITARERDLDTHDTEALVMKYIDEEYEFDGWQ